MRKRFFAVLAFLLLAGSVCVFAQESLDNPQEPQVTEAQAEGGSDFTGALKYIAAALAVGIACIGGGTAVGKIGAAAMGAMSENAELSGKALPFVGLAEGICLWGFLVALFIIIM